MTTAPFVSLNAWDSPGRIYQAAEPVEVVTGSAGDWERIENVLTRHRHAQGFGGAVGYITYEGAFWFGIFPSLTSMYANQMAPLWVERREVAERPTRLGPWRSNQTRRQFEDAVRAAQAHIAAGDIYQVNLAQRFYAEFSGNPLALFEYVLACSPAPGAAFLDTGERQILSASPELFLRIDRDRHITTRPIKGTRPRDADPLRDRQLADELLSDPKERAELLMITDLERNDLGRVCEFGSVAVPELLRLEKFAQVQHLVSTVTGRLRADVSPVQALTACFPGGSITGAPKRRAMEIIAELEPEPRGVYTGAIGVFGFDGTAAFSIAIRTLIHEPARGELNYHVGAGITAGSVPSREFDETMHKGAGLRSAVARYAQVGTPLRGVPFICEATAAEQESHGRLGDASLPVAPQP